MLFKGFEQEVPACKPWSFVPLLCIFIGALSIIGIIYLAKYIKKNEKNKLLNIVLFIYGLIFLSLEIYHEVNRYFTLGHYDFSSFPFQFCSIPIYICLILPFIKKESIRTPFFYYLGIFCLIAGFVPIFVSQGQLCRWSNVFDTIRSFVWHILILQVAILSLVYVRIGHNLKLTYKYFLESVGIFISITVIAQILNVILHFSGGVNYVPTDGRHYKDVTNTPLFDPDVASLFYISPFFVSNMPVYSRIWLDFGWVVNYVAYVFSFSLLAGVVYITNYLVRRCFNYFKEAKEVLES